ncbi:MAG: M48 family metalloprotease [Candidatus Aminicenantes bacterium]|nr:M48 family metalloprotease [Candidatus Aminicenantes bacterium]
MKLRQRFTLSVYLVVFSLLIISCSSMGSLSDLTGQTENIKTAAQKANKVRQSFADITEEEEYYIGRAVSAMILSRYPVYNNETFTKYINLLGNSVALYSNRPETYAGYHFLVLDSDEVNAMAAPGGFIFITKGLIKKCRNEEMLASVLAHEVGHVSAKHGLKSIKKSRLIEAFGILGQDAAQRFAPEELNKLTGIFENVLGDIAESLIERGYDRKYEYEADQLSLHILDNTGYNPYGLLDFLGTLTPDASSGAAKGWFKTHPSSQDRIERVQKELNSISQAASTESVRTSRFAQYMKLLK